MIDLLTLGGVAYLALRRRPPGRRVGGKPRDVTRVYFRAEGQPEQITDIRAKRRSPWDKRPPMLRLIRPVGKKPPRR